MKLRPLQIVGLVGLVVFGSILVFTLTKPRPDPFTVPGAMPLSDALPPPAEYMKPPPLDLATTPPANPMEVGSQDAKDDLYCSGVVFAVHQSSKDDIASPEADKRRSAVIALAVAGTGKLKAEGVATDLTTGSIADAHSEKALADITSNVPRITFDACMGRAAALPPERAN
ncbi:MAG: hypothetical protein Q8R02_13515 [Hyphomonadaceae bacterium]|nr:hypothetical protein [Hyphomonadaceae bacterium]